MTAKTVALREFSLLWPAYDPIKYVGSVFGHLLSHIYVTYVLLLFSLLFISEYFSGHVIASGTQSPVLVQGDLVSVETGKECWLVPGFSFSPKLRSTQEWSSAEN